MAKSISCTDITTALVVAVAADFIQLPLNLAFFGSLITVFGAAADIPLEMLDLAVDTVVACVTSSLLGFHWTLLPSFVLETIPGLDAAPTWTGCVAYLSWHRKNEGRISSSRG